MLTKIMSSTLILATLFSNSVFAQSLSMKEKIKRCYIETGLKGDSNEDMYLLNTLLISGNLNLINGQKILETASSADSCEDLNNKIISLMGTSQYKRELKNKSTKAGLKIGTLVKNSRGKSCNSSQFLWSSSNEGQPDFNASLDEILDQQGRLIKGGHGLVEMAGSMMLSIALARIEIAEVVGLKSINIQSSKQLSCSQLEEIIFQKLTFFGADSNIESSKESSQNYESLLSDKADMLLRNIR